MQAYRLEPLFRERYSNVEPVHIKGHAETNYSYDSSEQTLQPDSSGGTGNWLVYALLGRPKNGKAAEGNTEQGYVLSPPALLLRSVLKCLYNAFY